MRLLKTLIDEVKHRASNRQYTVIDRLVNNQCKCGFDVVGYRDAMSSYVTYKIKYKRSLRSFEITNLQCYRVEKEINLKFLNQSRKRFKEHGSPCPLCRIKYNPNRRQRANLPNSRSPKHFLNEGEIYAGITDSDCNQG